jgi:hypothetical protein
MYRSWDRAPCACSSLASSHHQAGRQSVRTHGGGPDRSCGSLSVRMFGRIRAVRLSLCGCRRGGMQENRRTIICLCSSLARHVPAPAREPSLARSRRGASCRRRLVHASCRPAPLPAGILKATNARRERDWFTMRVCLRTCTPRGAGVEAGIDRSAGHTLYLPSMVNAGRRFGAERLGAVRDVRNVHG